MTDISSLKGKVANGGTSDLGLCKSTDWNALVTAAQELQTTVSSLQDSIATLTAGISTEKSSRQSGDTDLSSQLTAAKKSLESADASIKSLIATAESRVTAKVTAEETRAKAAEENLENEVSSLPSLTSVSALVEEEKNRALAAESELLGKDYISQTYGDSTSLVMSQAAVKNYVKSQVPSSETIEQITLNKTSIKSVKTSLMKKEIDEKVIVNRMLPANPRVGKRYFFASGIVKICFPIGNLKEDIDLSGVSPVKMSKKTGIKTTVSAFIEKQLQTFTETTISKSSLSENTVIFLYFGHPVTAEVRTDGKLSTLKVKKASTLTSATESPYLFVEKGRVVCRKKPLQTNIDGLKKGAVVPFKKKSDSDVTYMFKSAHGHDKRRNYKYYRCNSSKVNKFKNRFIIYGRHRHHKSVEGVSVVYITGKTKK